MHYISKGFTKILELIGIEVKNIRGGTDHWRSFRSMSPSAYTRVFPSTRLTDMGQRTFCLLLLHCGLAFGWGELGHHVIARTAAQLVAAHPLLGADGSEAAKKLISTYRFRWYQQGHVANIPDVYWRDLDNGLKSEGDALGNSTHYINCERFLETLPSGEVSFRNLSLDYAEERVRAEKIHPDFPFFKVGTLPWRAQQFASLYARALSRYPKTSCGSIESTPLHPTREALTYAGLLAHFIGDASQPFHSTVDHDGLETGQGGIHQYFETDLVDSLELGLDAQVFARAKELLLAPATRPRSVAWFHSQVEKTFGRPKPENQVTALLFTEIADSFSRLSETRANDARYALAPAKEAWTLDSCRDLPEAHRLKEEYDRASSAEARKKIASIPIKSERKEIPACRRKPETRIDADGNLSSSGRTVAEWNRPLIIERLAVASALLADTWVHLWADSGRPYLCFTWQYALKPSFVSPTDKRCEGYVVNDKKLPSSLDSKDGSCQHD